MYPWNDWPYTNVHQLNLDWVIGKLKHVIDYLKRLQEQVSGNSDAIAKLQAQVNEMQAILDKLQAGGFDDLYLSAINKWVDEHLPEIIAKTVKYVFFGLTMDGHFCAVIPDSWDFIHFDTIMTADSPLFGHLVLRW